MITLQSKSGKTILTVDGKPGITVKELKKAVQAKRPDLYASRQSFKIDAKGKMLKDEDTVSVDTLIFKDLGPQIGWSTVFLSEYAGPIFAYMLFFFRPAFIYGPDAASQPRHYVVEWAAACWTFHYVKRILETIFVHRFSNATMPITNLLKNCSYYWGFAAFVSYFINHPLYTPPPQWAIYTGLAGFLFNELGNLSIHVALRNLRPPGSKERRIPMPTANPFTLMFNFASCANYTYEAGSWLFFNVMTFSVAGVLFFIAGTFQMTIWALGKQRNYRKEFPAYPKGRKAIIPFVI